MIFLSLLNGLIIFIAGTILKIKPPKNINVLYGYRTFRSMRNQRNWDAANRYSAELMIFFGGLLTVIGLFLRIFFSDEITFLLTTGIMVVFSILLIILVEKRLKRMDNEDLW